MNGNKPVAVVVNSGDSNGYGVVINLGRAGVSVLSLDSNPKNITFYSKYAKKILCPDYKISEKEFLSFLLNLGKQLNPKPVLFITGDLQLTAMLKHREKLEKYFHMPMASLEIVEKLVNKKAFYKILEKSNVTHAKTFIPECLTEVETISQQLDYPYIIKPVQSTSFVSKFGNKCLKVNSGKELIETYKKVAQKESDIIIQKEIEGHERYLVYTYLDDNSTPLAVCCYEKIRIVPIDYGNACVCKTVWQKDAVNITLNFLKSIKYTGLAEAEIQRDERDGRLKLVEINARTTTEARLSARCGMNMENIAYQDVLNIKQDKQCQTNNMVTWIDITRDIIATFSSDGYINKKKITFKQWLQSLKGTREYAYLAWDDPLPFTVLLFRFIQMYGFNKKRISDLYQLIRLKIRNMLNLGS